MQPMHSHFQRPLSLVFDCVVTVPSSPFFQIRKKKFFFLFFLWLFFLRGVVLFVFLWAATRGTPAFWCAPHPPLLPRPSPPGCGTKQTRTGQNPKKTNGTKQDEMIRDAVCRQTDKRFSTAKQEDLKLRLTEVWPDAPLPQPPVIRGWAG